MSAPRKYQEFRDRAVRMYRDRLAELGESKRGARRHVHGTQVLGSLRAAPSRKANPV